MSEVAEVQAAVVIDNHVGKPANGGTATGAWVSCACGEEIRGAHRDHATGRHRLHVARELDAAGLLVTPEHDAAVAAKALREAAEEVYGDDRAAGPYSHPLSVASWLRARADHIEGEGGAS